MMITASEIISLIILIGLSGIFSGSETALISVSRFKVGFFLKKKKKGSVALSRLKETPHRMLITLLICNNAVNIAASVIATNAALKIFEFSPLAYATGIMTFLILLFGEIVPKSIATSHANSISLIMAPIVYWLSIILYPVIAVFDFLTVHVFRVKLMQPKITEEEVRNIVDIAREEGGIDKQEKELIHRIFKFDDTDVDEIKVPRTDMIMINVKSKLKDALDIIKKKHYSRLPVFESTRDKIVGIFYFKDALDYIKKKRYNIPIEKLMRQAAFIPETKKIDETLKFLQKKNQQMAIIVDEHGGVSGLVTMEDILEEIVGEIRDETEKIKPEFVKMGKKSWKVMGKADIEDVNRKLRTKLSTEEGYDTFSGYILNKAGRIPDENEQISLDELDITIKKVQGNRIIEVIVKKK
ncbi:DUF21 domain-containing protein [Candidatus Woesearchaeota archaeon]|nr:DUF21 domain-containing protein [Candidatus Woesearchaeota archaeon]